MNNEMNLKVKNFGVINKADIRLKKLNVVAGENCSGKSTLSKLLSCFLMPNSNECYYPINLDMHSRFSDIVSHWKFKISLLDWGVNFLVSLEKEYFEYHNEFRKKYFKQIMAGQIKALKDFLKDINIYWKDLLFNEINDLERLMDVTYDKHNMYYNLSSSLLNCEFNFDELSLSDAEVCFYAKVDDCDGFYEMDFNQDNIGAKICENYSHSLDFDEVVYIDSSAISVFDESFKSDEKNFNHTYILSKQLKINKNEAGEVDFEKISVIQNKIEEMTGGGIYFGRNENKYLFKKDGKTFSMNNISSGIKQMGIIQILLEKNILNDNSFLIIDNPEVNLHQDWQLRFAELLIILIKQLDIFIYINSNSPLFIEALEVFSAKYGLCDESGFYLSCGDGDGGFSFKEIERKNLNILYDNLGNPYDKIDKIRIENSIEGIF